MVCLSVCQICPPPVQRILILFGRYTCGVKWHIVSDGVPGPTGGDIWGSNSQQKHAIANRCWHLANTNEELCGQRFWVFAKLHVACCYWSDGGVLAGVVVVSAGVCTTVHITAITRRCQACLSGCTMSSVSVTRLRWTSVLIAAGASTTAATSRMSSCHASCVSQVISQSINQSGIFNSQCGLSNTNCYWVHESHSVSLSLSLSGAGDDVMST